MAARLKDMSVAGFRCLDGLHLTLETLTALIGANGTGKSSVLRALQFLFGQLSLDEDDFTDSDTSHDLRVTVTFTDLPALWTERLGPWLDGDADLTISRHRTSDGSSGWVEFWTATRSQAPGFADVRAGLDSGALVDELKPRWVAAQEAVGGQLANWSSKAKAAETLDAFESEHPELCTEEVADRGLRFGPGGSHDLSAMVELLVLPAMRDAADDAGDAKGSTLSRLVDITVRAGMGLDERLSELSEKTAQQYAAVLAEASGTRLSELADRITQQLGSFAPGAAVTLAWEPRTPVLSPPPVRAQIVESGHAAAIGRQGHGVQRAYVFSLLRALLDARRGEETTQPGLVLAIEEPEVYQHPLRARYVARVLQALARDERAGTQVLYTTHSPYLVSVQNIASVRTLRMVEGHASTDVADPSAPTANTGDGSGARAETAATSPHPRTRATAPKLEDIAARLEMARAGAGKKWTPEKVAAQLPGLLETDVSEGLFADAVVLIEGKEDDGLINGAADAQTVDLAELGIAIISLGGKAQLPLAMEVFRAAGVPAYVIFDTDEDKKDPGALLTNSMITVLAAGTAEREPGTRVEESYASVSPTLRVVVDSELGAGKVRDAFVATAVEMGLPESTEKNGHLARTVIRDLADAGANSGTLQSIVHTVVAFGERNRRQPRPESGPG